MLLDIALLWVFKLYQMQVYTVEMRGNYIKSIPSHFVNC